MSSGGIERLVLRGATAGGHVCSGPPASPLETLKEFAVLHAEERAKGLRVQSLFARDSTPSWALSTLARRYVPGGRPYDFGRWLEMNYQRTPHVKYFGNRTRTAGQLWDELLALQRTQFVARNTLTPEQAQSLLREAQLSPAVTKVLGRLALRQEITPDALRTALISVPLS